MNPYSQSVVDEIDAQLAELKSEELRLKEARTRLKTPIQEEGTSTAAVADLSTVRRKTKTTGARKVGRPRKATVKGRRSKKEVVAA